MLEHYIPDVGFSSGFSNNSCNYVLPHTPCIL
jgi:hypothetical protein